jgi:HSP20 family molecular chaperone IbpA
MTIDTLIKTFYDDLENSISRSHLTKRNQEYVNLNTYKILEEKDNIIFKCLAPGMIKEDIDISFDRKKLFLKTKKSTELLDFKNSFDDSISLNKSIDIDNSFAELERGILTVTMPINKNETKRKINFR